MAADDERDWQALGQVVRARREQLDLNQAQLEGRGGPGPDTVRNVERVKRSSYSGRTLRSLESALQFPPGLLDQVLDRQLSPEDIPPVPDLISGPARVRHTVQPGELVFRDPEAEEGATEVVSRATLPGTPQTLRVAGRPSETRAGNPTVRPHPPSFARRRVLLDGTVLEYRSALSAEPRRIGRLPASYLPLLAALASLEEMDLGDANVGELATGTLDDQCRRDDLTAARDALTLAIATVADTVTLERDEAGTPRASAEFDSLVRAVLGGNTAVETLSFPPVRPS